MESEIKKDLTRRSFLTGLAAGSVGLAASTVLSGCGSDKSEAAVTTFLPESWDQEADIVVVGYGSAGAGAAMAAADAGANVILLEKEPEATAGGASSCFGGIIAGTADTKLLIGNAMGTMTDATAQKIGDEAAKQIEWMFKEGLEMRTDYPYLAVGAGAGVYKFLKEQVAKKSGISIQYGTPAKALIQDPKTKEVVGVVAEKGGSQIYVKAKKAVIITSGDYTANQRVMSQLHAPGLKIACVNSPASTGDGLMMGLAAGAALDNMGLSIDWFEFAFRTPTEKFGTAVSHRQWETPDLMNETDSSKLNNSRIFVNMSGQRFMNEKRALTHDKSYPLPFLNFTAPLWGEKGWQNLPAFLVCDDAEIKSGPLGKVPRDNEWEWAIARGIYNWSDDNSAEIEAGWLIKADTLDELATKMTAKAYIEGKPDKTVDAAALKATVAQYNEICASGNDPFGRPAATLKPIATPPFYAIELMACAVYSTGGLRYNENAQTVDNNDKPIPRLYSAGNVGQGLALGPYGVPGCLACGTIAARHAVALDAWA